MKICNHSFKSWFLATRPWSFSASAMPVIVTLSYLYYSSKVATNPLEMNWINGALAVVNIILLHAAGNLLSDYHDFKQGIDSNDSFGAKTITSGEFSATEIRNFGYFFLVLGIGLGSYLALTTGYHLWWIGGIGAFSALLYYVLKFNRLGDLCIFIAFGLLPPLGTAFVVTGKLLPITFLLSVPVGSLIVALLHSNNTRDIKRDTNAKINTFASTLGLKKSIFYYYFLVALPFIWVTAFFFLGDFPVLTLLVFLMAPNAEKCMSIMKSAKNNIENINFLDLKTANLQLCFSLILSISFLLSAYFTQQYI